MDNNDNLPEDSASETETKTYNPGYVQKLRKESENWRNKFKAANDRIVQAELRAASMRAGMVDADGYRMGDTSKVKLNEDGKLEGAEDLIEDLRKTKPFLFGKGSTGSGASSGRTSAASASPKPGEPQKFDSMKATPDEIKDRLKELLSRKD